MHILSGKKSFCMFKRYSFKIAFESYCAILITWTQIIMRFLKHLSYIYRNSEQVVTWQTGHLLFVGSSNLSSRVRADVKSLLLC